MSEVVYIKTSTFSFYHDERTTPAVVAMHQWTVEWWDKHRQRYSLFTSSAVLEELDTGELPHRPASLAMAQAVRTLPMAQSQTFT